jgi:hypothetical protein
MFRGISLGLVLAFCQNQAALAQTKNVQDAIDAIVMPCVAGGNKIEVSGAGSGDGGLELKKQGGSSSAGVTFSKSEAKGLVDGIRQEMSNGAASQASEARKCMQPYIDRIVDLILPPGSLSLQSGTRWNHNSSTMRLTLQGDRIMISYDQPRQGMIDEGVRPGTVLFDGRRAGNRISGTSYVFDRHCNSGIPYSDDGVISNDREIVLSGRKVPTQLLDCKPVAYRIDPSIFFRQN